MNEIRDKHLKNMLEKCLLMQNLVKEQLTILFKLINNENSCEEIFDLVKKNEKDLDNLENEISNMIVDIIALYQPQAVNLRELIATQRMIICLERIGDLIFSIVKIYNRKESESLYLLCPGAVKNMLKASIDMVNKAIKSFLEKDKTYAIWTIKNDDVVDDLYKDLINSLLKVSYKNFKEGQNIIDFILINDIVSNIERIADNATNIAEAVIYYLGGIDVRHNAHDIDSLL